MTSAAALPGRGRRRGAVLVVSRAPGPADAREAWREHWARSWDREPFTRMVDEAARLPFARSRQLVVALRSRGELLSAAKVYLLPARLGGAPVLAVGIGAVLTPRARRGRGHATALLRRVHDLGRRRGGAVAMLHSDIAPAFYERLGYVSLPLRSYRAPVDALPPPSRGLRAGRSPDVEAIMAAWREGARARYLGVLPDRGLLAFKLLLLARSHGEGPGRRGHPWHLAARDGSFLISRCSGDHLELVLWGGSPGSVLSLARAAADSVPATRPRRVTWEGPAARDLAAGLAGVRTSRDASFMARRLGPGPPLAPRGASDPFPIERF